MAQFLRLTTGLDPLKIYGMLTLIKYSNWLNKMKVQSESLTIFLISCWK